MLNFSYMWCSSVLVLASVVGITHAQENSSSDKQWCEYVGKSGPGVGKHVVLIAGDDEYRSEEALPMLGKILAIRHGFNCTVLFPINEDGVIQPDFQTNIPGLEHLENADLMILGLRFRNLPDDQMKMFDQYVESGRPIIAVRTSTHAFQVPKDQKYAKYSYNAKHDGWVGGFGQRVLGDTWINHHGHHGKESTRGVVNAEQKRHSILKGVDDVWGPTDVYGIVHLPAAANVLLHGQVIDGMKPSDEALDGKKNDPMMPLAWTLNYKTRSGKTAKVFCTTMGAATDFMCEDLRRLVVNAAFWCVGKEELVTNDLDVAVVDSYVPTNFGFKSYKKGKRPANYDLKKPANADE